MANDVPERSAEERAGEVSRRRVRRWLWGATAGTILLGLAAPAWRYYRIVSALHEIAAACRPGEFGLFRPPTYSFHGGGWATPTAAPENHYGYREPDWFPAEWWPFRGFSPFASIDELEFQAAPLDQSAALAPLLRLPGLERTSLTTPFSPDALRQLQKCRRLRFLNLGFPVTSEHLAVIGELPALDSLVLWDADVTGADFGSLGNASSLRSILISNSAGITPELLAALRMVPHLTALAVISSDLDRRCVDALCQFDRLTRLDVGSDLASEQLVRLMQLPNLEILVIMSTVVVSPRPFQAAERSPSLVEFHLNGARIELEPRVTAGGR